MPAPDTESIADGSVDFSGGVDSLKVPTVQSQININGLSRNQVAWAVNCIFRDGSIGQRNGWQKLTTIVPSNNLWQGGFSYQPDVGDAYMVCSISGVIWKVPYDGTAPVNLSTTASVSTPAPSVPLPPWTVTLKRLSFQQPQGGQFFTDQIVGVGMSCPPNYMGPLGNGPNAFQGFLLPSVNGSVAVTLASHYGGQVGDTFFLSQYVSGLFNGIFFSGTYTFKFQVTAFTAIPPSPANVAPVLTNPPLQPKANFCQAENFLVIQAGDGVTLPLFWDGQVLRRSRGITNTSVAAGTPNVNEIPAATAMDYYMGRLWYAQNRNYSAGDIVAGQSGTLRYNFRDAVLNVTESPLVLGGDGFSVPSSDGPITAIFHNGQIDASLGQGRLFIGTTKTVYSQQVPVSRTDWIGTTVNSQPIQTVVLLNNGPVNDTSVVVVNGDAFFMSLEPAIRSMKQATRFFSEWANVPLSSNVDRVFSFADPTLLQFASGAVFDNRLIETTLPTQTPQGVVHGALVPLDFTPISTFETELPPVWEGIYQGLSIFQVLTGLFSGTFQRAFAVSLSDVDNSIELYEIGDSLQFDGTVAGTESDVLTPTDANATRVQRVIEFPAYTWSKEFALKELLSAEMWVDRVLGTVHFKLEYRPDGDACWHPWFDWDVCSAKSSCEDVVNPICYPLVGYREGYRQTMTLPKPKNFCQNQMDRPTIHGYQFQCRLTILGWCRLRGFFLIGAIRERKMYHNLVCQSSPVIDT